MMAWSIMSIGCATTPAPPAAPELVEQVSEAPKLEGPDIKLRYGYMLDRMCFGEDVPQGFATWSAEFYTELPKLQALWDERGEALLDATVETFGKPYDREQMDATILLCHKWVPIGAPVIIPIWAFLDSATQELGATKLAREMFVSVLYHELLHVYLDDNFVAELQGSVLARELMASGESITTVTHVHIASIMTKVYTSTGQAELLERVIALEKTFSPDYARAWEIVQERGPEVFLAELGQ